MWNQGVGECGRGVGGASLVGLQPGLGGASAGGWVPEDPRSCIPLDCFLEVTVQSPEDQEKPGRIWGILQNPWSHSGVKQLLQNWGI